MAIWTAKHVWAHLDRETRETAAKALWEDTRINRQTRMAALAPWLTARGIRPAFLEQLPRTRRVQMLAEGGLPEETAFQVLMSYHLTHEKPLLSRFMDLLAIPHEDGLVKEGHELQAPNAEDLAKAVETIKGEFSEASVQIYFRTLLASDPETWEGLAPYAGDIS